LGLNQKTQGPPPKLKSLEFQIDYLDSQLPSYEEAFPDLDVFPRLLYRLRKITFGIERSAQEKTKGRVKPALLFSKFVGSV